MDITIRRITEADAPRELLYDADPSRGAVRDYLQRGMCYAAYIGENIVGEYVILRTRPFTMELVNLAVGAEYRNRGIAKKLVHHAVKMAKEAGCKVIEVGTGNAGIGQLALYQKCGFFITGVDIDFFRKHYPEPIFENGIECRHMVRLSMEL